MAAAGNVESQSDPFESSSDLPCAATSLRAARLRRAAGAPPLLIYTFTKNIITLGKKKGPQRSRTHRDAPIHLLGDLFRGLGCTHRHLCISTHRSSHRGSRLQRVLDESSRNIFPWNRHRAIIFRPFTCARFTIFSLFGQKITAGTNHSSLEAL